ncbi:MAG: PH domain-containing protein [Cryomorphaceae bacterium]|nr:PH domain-containing protein [Cryomorphaceae bacterium]
MDWYSPNRLSSFALVSSPLMFLRRFFRSAWVIFIPVLVNFNWQMLWYLLFIVIVISVIAIVLGVVYYFNYKYWATDKEIIVHEWFFRLKKISVPFDRIQSVSLEQTFLQKIMDVYQVKIDTAGSSSDEVNLKALDIEDALAFKAFIQEKTTQNIEEKTVPVHTDESAPLTQTHAEKKGKTLLHHSFGKLMLVGLTVNHLKSSVYIFIGIFYLLQVTERLHLENYAFEQIAESGVQLGSFKLWLHFLSLFVAISLLTSLVSTTLKYYNLTLTDFGKYLVARHGLLKTSEVHLRERRIQTFSLVQNPLQRLVNFKELRFRQVGKDVKSSLSIPGVNSETATNLLKAYSEDAYRFYKTKIDIHSGRRVLIVGRFVLFTLAFLSAGLFFPIALIVWPLLFVWLILGIFHWRSLNYYHVHLLKTGLEKKTVFFEHEQIFIRYEKIQAVVLSSNPISKALGFKNLTVYTAGGKLSLSYLHPENAEYLRDYLLYKVERENKTWM